MGKNKQKGFTLIEVLIALAIFTIIGIATVKHLQQIQTTKKAAFDEMDFYNEARAGLALLRNDLSQAFHVRFEDLSQETQQAVRQGQPVPHTIFDGRKSELVFTAVSHRLYYANKHESDQTEISYFLQRDAAKNTQTLMKRESEFIDGDLYQGGRVFTVLENVEAIEFKYWDDKQDKWVDDWSSDSGATIDRFPFAVRVKVTLASPRGKLEFLTSLKVTFPNNEREFAKL